MNIRWIVIFAIAITAVGVSLWYVSTNSSSVASTDTLSVDAKVPAYIAVASKLNGTQSQACAEAIVEKLGTKTVYTVIYNAAAMPPIKNDDKGLLVRDLSIALEKGSPQTLNESSSTLKTAIFSATSEADTSRRILVVVGQLPIDMNALEKDQKSVLLDPSDVARLSGQTGLLNIVFVVLPGTAGSNDAIIRLRGLLNRKGVEYDSVLVRMGGMNK
ncbi:MAG: hypothetical protein HYX66_09575 [Ignavibacteria bacterium]|nr:hypothetical protein [Ignavibacteria bacterium]